MMSLVSIAAALSFNRIRPLLVGFMLLTLVLVQSIALYRHAERVFEVHKHYGRNQVLSEFSERLTLDAPPAVAVVPVIAQTYEQPSAVLVSSFEGLAITAALPRAPPVKA